MSMPIALQRKCVVKALLHDIERNEDPDSIVDYFTETARFSYSPKSCYFDIRAELKRFRDMFPSGKHGPVKINYGSGLEFVVEYDYWMQSQKVIFVFDNSESTLISSILVQY